MFLAASSMRNQLFLFSSQNARKVVSMGKPTVSHLVQPPLQNRTYLLLLFYTNRNLNCHANQNILLDGTPTRLVVLRYVCGYRLLTSEYVDLSSQLSVE